MVAGSDSMFFRGNEQVRAVDAAHRGIAYGDGLFETMRVHAGTVPWWERHHARLAHGASRLGIPLPAQAYVEGEVGRMLRGSDVGVLKLILSRGGGARGYAAADADPCWQLSLHPLPASTRGPLALRWCALRLAIQPALAGLKHCNRLEQVLARAELDAPDAAGERADEGLLLDVNGDVTCAVSANVFALRGGIWRTPRLDRCGVAGVGRAWAMDALRAEEARMSPDDIERADALFLCNAVRGILAVARLGARTWDPHPAVAQARRLLAAAHPAFTEDTAIESTAIEHRERP
jgi:4-amino-4-deoxychorismate lyase